MTEEGLRLEPLGDEVCVPISSRIGIPSSRVGIGGTLL